MTATLTPSASTKAAPRAGARVLRWEHLTKTDFDAIDRARSVVVVTCSPLEVHGPHLPLGTDPMEGEGLAARMISRLPERYQDRTFLWLPYCWVGADVLPMPGSLHFRPETVTMVLEDLGRTLAAQGFPICVVSNFHGSPRHNLAIERACATVSAKTPLRMYPLFSLLIMRLTGGKADVAEILDGVGGATKLALRGDAHAGLVETAQILALHGDLVRQDFASLPRHTVEGFERLSAEEQASGALRSGGMMTGKGEALGVKAILGIVRAAIDHFSKHTYAGAPGGATKEMGEAFLDRFGGAAAEALGEILEGKILPKDCHTPMWKMRHALLQPAITRVFNAIFGYKPVRV